MQDDKQYKWYKVAESIAEIKQVMGNPCLVKAGGKEICLSVHHEEAMACAAKCPHAGGHLHRGWVDALGHIVCPLHRYRFDAKNGRNTSGEGYYVKSYPVKENDDGIFVGIE